MEAGRRKRETGEGVVGGAGGVGRGEGGGVAGVVSLLEVEGVDGWGEKSGGSRKKNDNLFVNL